MNRPLAPLFATVNVTTDCNLDCAYCFMQPRGGDYMLRSDFERILDELAASQVFLVNISGGEPFMHPDIAHFLRIAHRRFRHVMTLTNGTLLRPEHFAAISEILGWKGAFTVQISVDSVDPKINAKTRNRSVAMLRNIERLGAMGVHVIVATVVTRFNIESLTETITELSRYTRYFHLMTVQDVRCVDGVEKRCGIPREREDLLWDEIQRLAEDRDLNINTPLAYEGYRGCAEGAPCMAAFSHIVIDPGLAVRPCDRLTDVALGSLRTATLGEIWNGPAVQPILESPVPYCRIARRGTGHGLRSAREGPRSSVRDD